ncbi:MAG: serine/threonine-protein kinase [Isosphaeraceae bacterium]
MSVRMVCGGCLRSVEVWTGPAGNTCNVCPYCNYCNRDTNSRQDNAETQTAMTQGLEGMLEAEPSASDSSLGWTGTWFRGSLGSLGRFQLRERLGDGGFGQVFLAFDPRLDRDVALKVLKQPDPNERMMERFFREARAAARLDHPNIVAVHDAGFNDGRCWVAFHFVSGRPLNWYRDQHRLDPPTAARILRDLANAVDHAHRQGVLHRDIKPANVLIDDHGRPRLIDFGLARRSDLDSSLTLDGTVVGTPAYMSPEQALGFSSQVDERSDVFSLGVIFFEVLSGERPYSAASRSGPSNEAAGPPLSPGKRAPPPSVRTIQPAVPAALDRICMRAIAQDPRDRYASARALADDLDQWLLQHRGGEVRVGVHGSTQGKTEGSRESDIRNIGVLLLSTITKAACFPVIQGVNAYKVRLSFSITTIILGLAAALLLVIGIRAVLAPWNDGTRSAASANQARSASPAAGAARSSDSDQPRPLLSGPSSVQLIGNPSKGRYHLSTCPDIQSMNPSNKVVLRDADAARAAGLQPCAHCHPPVGLARQKANDAP